jgi:hypothetical protein
VLVLPIKDDDALNTETNFEVPKFGVDVTSTFDRQVVQCIDRVKLLCYEQAGSRV